MPRKQGTTELFTLVHSLSPEEKGYFKKFASRHSTEGSKYLQLFDAISKQTAFEETTLKKKFKSYVVMKVYLKEMITDSLLLYYRQQHPHIDLLSQIQKVHVLLMKGMQDEALKILDKASKQAEKIEVFEVSRYLLRLKNNLFLKTIKAPTSYSEIAVEYLKEMEQLEIVESDLLQWEIRSLKALSIYKGIDVFNAKSYSTQTDQLKNTTTQSHKSNLIKLETLVGFYKAEANEQELYNAANEYASAASAFKQVDSSYNDTMAINNYLNALADYSRFNELLTEYEKIIAQPRYDKHQQQKLFVLCITYKITALVHLGKFKEALVFIQKNETLMEEASNFTHDAVRLRVFYFDKLIALFLNKQYRDTWVGIQQIHQKTALKSLSADYADLKMLELMTQFMLGNFDLLKNMASKTKKEFLKNKIQSVTYQTLLKFFSKASLINYKQEAKKVLEVLTQYYTDNKKYHRKAFARIRYTYWLEEISGGRTIQKSLQEQFGG